MMEQLLLCQSTMSWTSPPTNLRRLHVAQYKMHCRLMLNLRQHTMQQDMVPLVKMQQACLNNSMNPVNPLQRHLQSSTN